MRNGRECGITHEESDEWSYYSHVRAVEATKDGRFGDEIVPVTVPAGHGETVTVSLDEHPRADTTLEKLAALPVLSGLPDGIDDRRGARRASPTAVRPASW